MDVEKTAPSVDEAVAAALEELGLEESQVDIEVVNEPKKGVLGMGAQEAKVRVRRARGPEPTESELDEQADVAADFLEGLLEVMDIDADVETNLEHGRMYVEIWAPEGDQDEMGMFIGHHGAVLDAMQELTRIVVSQATGQRCRITVDIEDYQKRKRSRLVSQARDVAKRVQRTGESEAFEAMNAYERKIVHDAVADMGGVESSSEGEDPDRYVVVSKT